MKPPEIALAASARDWSDMLHRFILDHGGGVVRSRLMSGDQAMTAEYDVLLIDDVCSFLTTRLVQQLRGQGRAVIGVFDPMDGADAKRRLLEVGISDVIEADATTEEFLALCVATIAHAPIAHPAEAPHPESGTRIAVTGAPGGVGVTEISCHLALVLSHSEATVLVDANQRWPSIAQRMGLDVHPNLLSAIDLMHHEPTRVDGSLQKLDSLDVVGGLANPLGATVSSADIRALTTALTSSHRCVVVDLGPVDQMAVETLGGFDVVLLVGTGTPVGVTRLIRAYEQIGPVLGSNSEIAVVVNRVERSSWHRNEIRRVLHESIDCPLVLIGEDGGLAQDGWNAALREKGRFHARIARMAKVFEGRIDNRGD